MKETILEVLWIFGILKRTYRKIEPPIITCYAGSNTCNTTTLAVKYHREWFSGGIEFETEVYK